MTAKEAHNKLSKFYPAFKAAKCIEYKTVFVFQMVPSGIDENNTKLVNQISGGFISVDKKNGIIKQFLPLHMPLEEYKAGKQIKNFK